MAAFVHPKVGEVQRLRESAGEAGVGLHELVDLSLVPCHHAHHIALVLGIRQALDQLVHRLLIRVRRSGERGRVQIVHVLISGMVKLQRVRTLDNQKREKKRGMTFCWINDRKTPQQRRKHLMKATANTPAKLSLKTDSILKLECVVSDNVTAIYYVEFR